MRIGRTSRLILGALVVIGIAVAGTALARAPETPAPGTIVPPVGVEQDFKRFADSAGGELLDALFALGYHGGYAWDEKSALARPNLIVRTVGQPPEDALKGIHEGTLTLDLHHDSASGVPPTVMLRFARSRRDPVWTLLTTDGYPEDPQPGLRLEEIQRMPSPLHAAIRSAFATRAERIDWWKRQEDPESSPAADSAPRP